MPTLGEVSVSVADQACQMLPSCTVHAPIQHVSCVPQTLREVVSHTAESGRCLLHSGTGDQAVPAQ